MFPAWRTLVWTCVLPGCMAFAPCSGVGLSKAGKRAFVFQHHLSLLPQVQGGHSTRTSLQMGFFDNLLGNSKGLSGAGVSDELPPNWTQETDASSGDLYYYNAATGETTWDRPPAPAQQQQQQQKQQRKQDLPAVPKSYEEIHTQAINAVEAGLKAGKLCLEVEFPAIAQTNKISDGSASSQAIVRRANAAFNAKMAVKLSGLRQRVVVLCADSSLLEEMSRQSLPRNGVCALIKDADSLVLSANDLVLSCQPADSKAWIKSAQLAQDTRAAVVVINGYQYNGYQAFDMAYYLKPMTFNSGICGYCIRAFPNDWVVWSAKTAQPLDYQVTFVEAQGCLRPDLQKISLKLTS